MVEVYVIGTKPVPEWCRRLITPYKRLDGGIGYEFHGKRTDFSLQAGDELEWNGYEIHVRSYAHDD